MTQAIIRQENIQAIVMAAPQSYQDNKLSRERCVEAGQAILEAIERNGMDDELDRQAAVFIEKARKTVKKMNERRSPVTKLFDDIRKEFTAMENAIDPTKADTVPFKLQQLRNRFAAKKRAEEEERRLKEEARQRAEAARAMMRHEIEDDFKRQFSQLVSRTCDALSALDNGVTLDNYDATFKQISDYGIVLPGDFIEGLHTFISIPDGVVIDELRRVEEEVKSRLAKQFGEQYEFEVGGTRQYILDRLPSKKTNLERMAQASAEEAARIKAEMEARRRKEAEQQEEARRRKEEEERQKAEMARRQEEMNSLFGAQVVEQNSQSKIKVTKKIELLNPEGIMPILSMWWSKEGCRLSVEEVSKMFRKQITYCERLANKDEIFIEDESVVYIEDVKAK